MQANFGIGQVVIETSTGPVQLTILKDVALDMDLGSIKELRGQLRYAQALGQAAGKISGKAKTHQLFSTIMATLLVGSTSATGTTTAIFQESATIPGTPYAITVAQTATFKDDLGVTFAATGVPLMQVQSGTPTTGQYKVSAAGVYTFAAADTTLAVKISYSYTIAGGNTVTLTNQLMGTASTFKLMLFNDTAIHGTTKHWGVKLFEVAFDKFAFGMKSEDWAEQDISFIASADAGGNVIEWYESE